MVGRSEGIVRGPEEKRMMAPPCGVLNKQSAVLSAWHSRSLFGRRSSLDAFLQPIETLQSSLFATPGLGGIIVL